MPDQIYINENGQQSGPMTEQQVKELLQQRRISAAAFCWFEGMAAWQPLSQALPGLFAAPAPVAAVVPGAPAVAPSPAQAAGPAGTTEFEIIKSDLYQMPKITLKNAEVVLESGALHYMIGNITIESQLPSMGGFLKSALTKEKAVRPRYRGTGTIFLEPTFGQCNILELNGDQWILDKGAYLASDGGIQIDMYTNKSLTGLFGGEGFFQTSVCGYGKVLYFSRGPLEAIHLNGTETLVVDGPFAVARTASLEYRVEKAVKKFFGSFTSGEGLVNTFSGTGTVMIAPVPNRFLTLINEFGGLHAAIRAIRK
ncbi:MAG: AIM24 family protein [Acidobacteriota bacterium]